MTFKKSFLSAFLLTITNPLTIVFWSSVFISKAVEKAYIKSQLVLFGTGAGFATFFFLIITMFIISIISGTIPPFVITLLNLLVGFTMIIYSIIRFIKAIKIRVR